MIGDDDIHCNESKTQKKKNKPRKRWAARAKRAANEEKRRERKGNA